MADAIDQAIRDRATLLIDAPPGWGKSLAALVPIAARDGEESLRAAYCTGTIALQEQLIGKDVPLVQRAFGRPDAALLKGFSHYLCRVKSDRWATEMFDRGGAAVDPATIQAFVRWMAETAGGDEAELVPRPSWWRDVAASHEDCIGTSCAHYPEPDLEELEATDPDAADRVRERWASEHPHPGPPCFAVLGRRAALGARLIVTNHHLLLFLERYRQAHVPPLLVIDEAHKLAKIASSVYGAELDELRFYRMTDRLRRDLPVLESMIQNANASYLDLLDALPRPKDEPVPLPEHVDAVAPFMAHLEALDRELEKIGDQRAQLERAGLASFRDTLTQVMTADPARARWVEPHPRERKFQMAPIETGPVLASLFAPERGPRIVMSATLSAGASFAHVERACGITQARHLRLPSGFDYAQQMRYFLPLPPRNPQDRDFLDAVGPVLRTLVLASRGRALVLCTSFVQVEAMDQALRGVPYPVLKGDARSGSLATAFRDDLHSILIGMARYWEGLDVPGPSCSLVVIVRLPFDQPDPLTEARYAAATRRGLQWFHDLAVPEAIVKLRQGVGRLIRSETDRGVVAILDGRLDTKRYGQTMLQALPHAPVLRRVDEVAAFLEAA